MTRPRSPAMPWSKFSIRIILVIAIGTAPSLSTECCRDSTALAAAERPEPGRCRDVAALHTLSSCDDPPATTSQFAKSERDELPGGLVPLGSALFRSTALSGPDSVSCSTCHVPALGFSGDRPLASNVDGSQRSRHSPTLFGLMPEKNLLWDGRVETTKDAILNALGSSEMDVDWEVATKRLRTAPAVLAATHEDSTVLSRDVAIRALVAYVHSISRPKTRFDQFRDGDPSAITGMELLSFRIFTHKAHCSSCHIVDGDAAAFTDGGFHRNGLTTATSDLGRAIVSHRDDDIGAFKTPSLRGVALRPYLMHDGSFTSLRDVVAAYNHAGGPRVDPRIAPILLSDDEINALMAFLETLNPE